MRMTERGRRAWERSSEVAGENLYAVAAASQLGNVAPVSLLEGMWVSDRVTRDVQSNS